MKVAIIGAGLTGLSAGYYLSKKGVKVEIFEKESAAGGLTASFREKDWQWPLEYFFHHLFLSDKALLTLTKELGIDQKIFFRRPITSIFIKKEIFPFDSPTSILKFPYLSLPERIRMGVGLIPFRFNPYWKPFEKTTAAKLLPKLMGEKAYQILWQPLFTGKFGPLANEVSAAWFWARINKRSVKLGYFEGGFQTLIEALVKEIEKNGGQIHLDTTIAKVTPKQAIGKNGAAYKFDKVLITTPIPVFLKIAPKLPASYLKNLRNLKMIGAINLVLESKKPFLTNGTYWLNINNASFPFCAFVEHTNFINPKHYGGNHILYVGGYYPPDHQFFKMTKKEILETFKPFLLKINPKFNILHTTYYILHTNFYAQPIIPVNYSRVRPKIATPVPNLYLATLHHIYPWDRGVNYAIKLGREAAREISNV